MRTRATAVVAGAVGLLITGGALAACSAGSGSASSAPASQRQAVSPHLAAGLGSARKAPAGSAGATAASATAAGATVTAASELIVRTGSVTLQVAPKGVVGAFDTAEREASALGGFVASSATTAGGDASGASLVLRVPSNSFASLVVEIDKVGKVEAQQVTGRDVTGQSIDLNARIANLTSEEEALRRLMSQSSSIPNLLQVQDQLFGVEGEIEQLSAQESSLLDHASFATLDVALRAQPTPVPPPRSHKQERLPAAWQLAGHNTVEALRAIAIAAGWAFPLLAIAAVGGALWIWRRRRSRSRPPTPISA